MMENDEDDTDEWQKPVEDVVSPTIHHTKLQNSAKKSSTFNKSDNKGYLDHSRVILHIDIDCFYAQVEMIRNPALREKPFGIQQKYTIVTCNYPARELGVSKLCTIKDAREKCPSLILVSGEDLTNYREMSYKISAYLLKYCPLVERLGLDENFLDITKMVSDRLTGGPGQTEVKGHLYNQDSVKDMLCPCGCHERLMIGSQIAAEIRAGLYTELGITCCGGIAHNKLLSKLVAGTHKPNQQTTLFPEQTSNLMAQLPSVRNITGIGHTTAVRLRDIGIVSVSDLDTVDLVTLTQEFGITMAECMKKLSRGIDDSPVVAYGLPQTLSDEDSFWNCCTLSDAKLRIQQLILSLLQRLVKDGRIPHTFRLTIRKATVANKYTNRESRQCPIPASLFSKTFSDDLSYVGEQLVTLAMTLLSKMVDTNQAFHLTLINVAFAKLEQKSSNSITNFFSTTKSTGQQTLVTATEQASADNEDTVALEKNMTQIKQKMKTNFFSTPKAFQQLTTGDSNKRKETSVTQTRTESEGLNSSSTFMLKNDVESVIHSRTVESSSEVHSDFDCANTSDLQDETRKGTEGTSLKGGIFKWLNQSSSSSNSPKISNLNFAYTGHLDLVQSSSPKIQGAGSSLQLQEAVTTKSASQKRKFEQQNHLDGLERSKFEGIDKSVLKELPPDIQKEILAELNYSQNTKKVLLSSQTTVFQGSQKSYSDAFKERFEPERTTFKNTTTDQACFDSEQTGKLDQTKSAAPDSFLASTSKQSETYNSILNDAGKKSCSKSATTTDDFIPPNIDRAVFISLPEDIRQEYIQEWRNKTRDKTSTKTDSLKDEPSNCRQMPSTSPSQSRQNTIKKMTKHYPNAPSQVTTKPSVVSSTSKTDSSSGKAHFKMPKPSASNNMLSYFSKSNKK